MALKKRKQKDSIQDQYMVDVMLHIAPRAKSEEPEPVSIGQEGTMEVIPVLLECVYEVSSIRIMLPDDLTNAGNKMLVKETLLEVSLFFII